MRAIKVLFLFCSAILLIQCGSTKSTLVNVNESENTHELVVFDTRFNSWLVSQPSIEMYSYAFLKAKNTIFASEYNSRANNRQKYNADLYPQPIDYSPSEEYDKELQYNLYNYFIYFQKKYNQRL